MSKLKIRRRGIVSILATAAILAAGCEEDPSGLRDDSAWLTVSTAVSGGGFDADGYELFVEGDRMFRRLEPVDTLRFQVRSRTVAIELADVAQNCVIHGEGNRSVAVDPGGTTEVSFVVSCSPPTELASILLLLEHVDGSEGTNLYRVRADGSEWARVVSNGSEPAVSADGSRVAFVRWTSAAGQPWQSEILTVLPGDPAPVRLTDEELVSSPTWSPDGLRLAYVSGDGWWFGDIRVRDVTGGDPTVLHGSSSVDTSPAWSPDGSLIAFSRGDETGLWLCTMTPDGGDLLQIAEGGTDPVWSPAADRIAFQHRSSASLVPAEGGAARLLVAGSAGTTWRPTGWTADGQWIVLTRWHLDRSDVYVFRPADETLLRVTADGVSRGAVPLDD